MPKVWIEAALNGPWGRKHQPGIPDSIEAIVAEGTALIVAAGGEPATVAEIRAELAALATRHGATAPSSSTQVRK